MTTRDSFFIHLPKPTGVSRLWALFAGTTLMLVFLNQALCAQVPERKEPGIRVPPGTKLKAKLGEKSSGELVVTGELSAKAYWQLIDKEMSPYRWRIEGLEKPILPVKYVPQNQIALVVNIDDGVSADPSKAEDSELRIDLSGAAADVKVRNVLSGESKVWERELKPNFNSQGIAVIRFDLSELLTATGSLLNQNALEALVTVRWKDRELRVPPTTNLVHILRQKLILFVPGVCGSRITVASHPEREAYPEVSLTPATSQFQWLSHLKTGDPESTALRLDLLRSFGGYEIYSVESRTEVTSAPNHRKLYRSGGGGPDEEVPYYIVKPWPYDWRLRLDYAVDLLMDRAVDPLTKKPVNRLSSDPVWPPYQTPPPLAKIVEEAKKSYPFLDSKIAVVAHSTGGLITRSLLKEPKALDYVDRAFFVDVPFWGAPKAYYVYLSGDMGLPFIRSDFMRDVSMNMPILYYLAPTERYPEKVASIRTGRGDTRTDISRTPGQDVASFMNQLINEAKEKALYPRSLDPWNEGLEHDAQRFHAAILDKPSICPQKCTVFWSDSHALLAFTVGKVWIAHPLQLWPPIRPNDGSSEADLLQAVPEVIGTDITRGDGTVPVVSQKADFDKSSLIQIPEGPDHVASPNSPFVWKKIIEILSR